MTPEFQATYGKDRVPSNFNELKQAIGEQWVSLFHSELEDFQHFSSLADIFSPAVACESPLEEKSNYKNVKLTNNDKWFYESLKESKEIKASAIPNMYTHSEGMMLKWEPFLIVARTNMDKGLSTMPRYNELFFGRMKNKISFVNALRILNYQFFYIRHDFIVHMEHPFSIYRATEQISHYEDMKTALKWYIKDMELDAKSMGFAVATGDPESEPLHVGAIPITRADLVAGTSMDGVIVSWFAVLLLIISLGTLYWMYSFVKRDQKESWGTFSYRYLYKKI